MSRIRVCSMTQSGTWLMRYLGLTEQLCGKTYECPGEAPVVVRSFLEGHAFDGEDIDRIVAAAFEQHKRLLYIDPKTYLKHLPDVVLTDSRKSVFTIDEDQVVDFAMTHSPDRGVPSIVPVDIQSLENLCETMDTLYTVVTGEVDGSEARRPSAAYRKRIQDARLRILGEEASPHPRKVAVLVWRHPDEVDWPWVKEQFQMAGAEPCVVAAYPGYLRAACDVLQEFDPDVLLLLRRFPESHYSQHAFASLMRLPGLSRLRAVKNSDIYTVEESLYGFASPALVDGIDALAAILHPRQFSLPARLRTMCQPIVLEHTDEPCG